MIVTEKSWRNSFSVLALFFLFIGTAYAEEDQEAGGLPVPRFASLRSAEVNLRIGPGTRYSISWVYKREGWPVEIIQEFNQWREIRDIDGTTGWVHKQMLQGKRTALIRSGMVVLRYTPKVDAAPILKAESGVVGRLLACEKDWCRLQIDGRKGWVTKKHIWGVFADEKF